MAVALTCDLDNCPIVDVSGSIETKGDQVVAHIRSVWIRLFWWAVVLNRRVLPIR
jgi:hypothetical protein